MVVCLSAKGATRSEAYEIERAYPPNEVSREAGASGVPRRDGDLVHSIGRSAHTEAALRSVACQFSDQKDKLQEMRNIPWKMK